MSSGIVTRLSPWSAASGLSGKTYSIPVFAPRHPKFGHRAGLRRYRANPVRFRPLPRVFFSGRRLGQNGEGTMGSLDGKVAIVTGAGQGVGAGIALALAKEGAAIVAAGRTEAKLHDICAKIEASGARALGVAGDVMS